MLKRKLIFTQKAFQQRYLFRYLLQNKQLSSSATNTSEKFFTKKHEWVRMNKNIGTIGISNYAQESLGDIVFVQLPEINSEVNASGECGAIESVKSASELYSPLCGTVTEVNQRLEEQPELINTDCYGEGWMFKLKVKDMEETKKLMTEDQYKSFLETELDSHS